MTGSRSKIRASLAGLRAQLGSPVVQFTLAGLAAVTLVGLVAAYLLGQAGTDEAIRDAKQVSALAGEGIVQPVAGDGLLTGDPRTLARVDSAVREHVLGRDGIIRVKIWDRHGRIVYSDEERLVGGKFVLGGEERTILQDGGIEAEKTDLSRPENRFEDSSSDLLEVYLPIQAKGGEPLLFETYIKSSFVSSAGQRIWSTLAPVLIGALIMLAALQLPLAISLAKRLRKGQRDREELLERAIDASESERRRIAQDLHDGVVQDLAGVSYSVAAAANRAQRGGITDAGSLQQAASRLRQAVRDLRGLLVEIYPPDLHRVGIKAGLSDIIDGLNSRGLVATLTVPDYLALPAKLETLFFRITQEAVRNVVAHADAELVEIRISEAGDLATLEIEDDGRGFHADAGAGAGGHFGLRMLSDLATDAGGTCEIDSEPGRGTRIRVEAPTR